MAAPVDGHARPPGADLERELRDHHAAAYGWALNVCAHDAALAQDVLHDAYLRVLDGRARFRGESAFRTWLFAVVRRVAGEYRRRGMLRDALLLRWWRPEAPAADEGGAEPALRAALQALPRRQREVLTLVFYHELSIAQAAQVMAVALGTARLHYERGKAALRRALRVDEESA